MRTLRRVFALGALATLAAAGVPSAGAQTPTVTSVIGAADGFFLEIGFEDNGVEVVTFGPEPSVVLPSEGGSVSDELLDVDEALGFFSLTAALLSVAAEGALGPEGFATAETTVTDLSLLVIDSVTPQVIDAQAIAATCAADFDGVTASTTLVDAAVLGEDVSGEPEPNTEISIDLGQGLGTATLVLNRQVENADGSLSVTALALDFEVVDNYTVSLEVGPATCGVLAGEIPAAQPVPATVTFTG